WRLVASEGIYLCACICASLAVQFDPQYDYLSRRYQNPYGLFSSLGYPLSRYYDRSNFRRNTYDQLGLGNLLNLGGGTFGQGYSGYTGTLGSNLGLLGTNANANLGLLRPNTNLGLFGGASNLGLLRPNTNFGLLGGGSNLGFANPASNLGLIGGTGGLSNLNGYRSSLPYLSTLGLRNLGLGFSGAPTSGTTTIDGSISGAIRSRDFSRDPLDGSYSFSYETDDGVQRQETGAPLTPTGAIAKEGSYSFTYPDGTPARFNYIADENGFQVRSNLLPELPDHVVAQIQRAQLERQAGIIHDGQYKLDDNVGNSAVIRSSFIDEFRPDRQPFSPATTNLSGRLNGDRFSPLRARGQRFVFGRRGNPLFRTLGDDFDESEPSVAGKSLSGHVKREDNQQIKPTKISIAEQNAQKSSNSRTSLKTQ
ncbi:Cuticle protein, partial [Armadillidium vulgare]